VDDSFSVRRIQCVRNLNPQLQHFRKRQRLARNLVLQSRAVEELHRNEVLAVLFADVVNGANVRVIQCGGGLCFTSEAFQRSGVVEHLGRQEFQTYSTMEPCVLCLVDHTHPAAKFLEDAIVRDGLVD
jgi:hypothetical protein